MFFFAPNSQGMGQRAKGRWFSPICIKCDGLGTASGLKLAIGRRGINYLSSHRIGWDRSELPNSRPNLNCFGPGQKYILYSKMQIGQSILPLIDVHEKFLPYLPATKNTYLDFFRWRLQINLTWHSISNINRHCCVGKWNLRPLIEKYNYQIYIVGEKLWPIHNIIINVILPGSFCTYFTYK